MRLMEAFSGHDVSLVTYDAPNTRQLYKKLPGVRLIAPREVQVMTTLLSRIRFYLYMAWLSWQELMIYREDRPDVIVSTGSEIAIPICYIGKLLGSKIVYVESICRINAPSATARAVYPISDLFLTQWEELSEKMKRAHYRGNVLGLDGAREKEDLIFATVGTIPFPRLVETMDSIAPGLGKKVIMQIADTGYAPKNARFFGFVGDDDVIRDLNRRASIVVCSGGAGSIISALECGAKVVVMPRRKKYGEHNYDDDELARKLLTGGFVSAIVYDPGQLESALRVPGPGNDPAPLFRRSELVSFIRQYIETTSLRG